MNIKDEFEKFREQILTRMDLFEDKIKETNKVEPPEEWTPRVGEIVEMSDDGEKWYVQKFVMYDEDCDSVYPFIGDYESFKSCRPLNNPMVIQLIPHKPGDPMPCSKDKDVITLHGNEFAEERYYTASAAGESLWDMCDSESDVFGWAPLNED